MKRKATLTFSNHTVQQATTSPYDMFLSLVRETTPPPVVYGTSLFHSTLKLD